MYSAGRRHIGQRTVLFGHEGRFGVGLPAIDVSYGTVETVARQVRSPLRSGAVRTRRAGHPQWKRESYEITTVCNSLCDGFDVGSGI
jgi:hypothetical protein